MISEYIKNLLATANGEEFIEKRYIDLVRELGKRNYALEDEVAILRKIVFELLFFIETIHPDIREEEIYKEFIAYHENYEAIKSKVKTDLEKE